MILKLAPNDTNINTISSKTTILFWFVLFSSNIYKYLENANSIAKLIKSLLTILKENLVKKNKLNKQYHHLFFERKYFIFIKLPQLLI